MSKFINITKSLLDPVSWQNGAMYNIPPFDFGTAMVNSSSGNSPVQDKELHTLDDNFDSGVVDPDELSLASLSGISVDDFGNIEAAFSNGLTQVIYNIPLACFANPNGLTPSTGNAGTIVSQGLEESKEEAMIYTDHCLFFNIN